MNQQTWNYSRNHWKSLQEPQEMCRYYSSLTLQLSVNFKILFVSLWSYQLFWHNFFPLSVSTDHKALSFWFLKQSFVIFCCLNHRRILLWDGIVQSVCGDFKKRYFLVFFLTGNVLCTCTIYTLYMRNYCPFSPGASLAVAGNIVLTQITTESRVHELQLALRRCCTFTNQRASWDPEAGICSMVPPH